MIVLKNKLAHTLTIAFLQLYPSVWGNFFDELIALIRTNVQNGYKFNTRALDFFLRVLASIDEEVANLIVPRDKAESVRNTLIVSSI
jgi:exportin-T